MAMTTDDPKDYRINLRINEEMNKRLIEESSKQGLSVAEYVRNLINDSFSKQEYDRLKELIKRFACEVDCYKKEYEWERDDLIKSFDNFDFYSDNIAKKASKVTVSYEKFTMAKFNFSRLCHVLGNDYVEIMEQYLKD